MGALGFVAALLGAGEQGDGAGERKAHDVEVAAFDAGDPAGGIALDAIGSGFVHGLAAHEVVDELLVVDEVEEDLGNLDLADHAGAGDGGDSGEDLVGASGEELEYAARVGLIDGFAEDFAVEDDGGVGAQDDEGVGGVVFVVAAAIEDGLGFFDGEALDVLGGGLVGLEEFIEVGGLDGEGEADLFEELAAARRG